MSKTHTYLLSWCIDGLEYMKEIDMQVFELSQSQKICNILAGDPDEAGMYSDSIQQLMHNCIIRAKFNSDRHYEIYVVDAEFDEPMMRKLFAEDTQVIVDVIRDKGKKLYSNRLLPSDIKII